ncbi:MAG: PspA/IM30 family protein [Porticoccaceae bacterium]|nr:PspA/IM30 family protein [Porticoccaceae bacterium]
MALINRISRLFRADFHAVLDRIEEPDALLKQSVREMTEAIATDERRLSLLEHELNQLEHQSTELDQALDRIKQELDVCFAAEQEDLARSLIRRRLETQGLLGALQGKQRSTTTRANELKQRVDENRSRLDSMEQKLELFSSKEFSSNEGSNDRANGYSQAGQSGTAICAMNSSVNVKDEEVEVAFLAEKQRRAAT